MADFGSVAPLIIAAAASMGAGPGADAPAAAPISLVAETTAAGVELRVVGRSPVAVAASYTLEVVSGPSSGNKSVQSGSATLRPDQPVVLLTTRLGGVAGSGWRARLLVTGADGASYEMTRQAD